VSGGEPIYKKALFITSSLRAQGFGIRFSSFATRQRAGVLICAA
jgi:hypothetical protein